MPEPGAGPATNPLPSTDVATERVAVPRVFLEVERKFRVHGLFRLPPLELTSATLGSPTSFELAAAYLDTADLRLARWGVTLRRREGGADAGWHLKLPVRQDTREEISVGLDRGAVDAPPSELLDLILAVSRTAPLKVVADLRTERTAYPIRDDAGQLLAELTDDSVSVMDGDRIVARFRELETELVDGEPSILNELQAALTEAGALPGGGLAKVRRALGPLAAAAPDVPEPADVKATDPAADAVQAYLARNTRALILNDIAVRRDQPDSVHRMRVAARELRSGLKVFEPLVEELTTRSLRMELAWLAGVLGEVRDREVLRERLLRGLDTLAADRTIDVDLTAARRLVRTAYSRDLATARSRTLTALHSERYLRLLDDLVSACANTPTTTAAAGSCAETLPPLVRRAWRRLSRDMSKLDKNGSDSEWHEARIAAKRARYACEAVAPVLGKPAKKLATQAERVTEVFGDHQDAVMAAEAIRALASRDRIAGSTGLALGLLLAQQRESLIQRRDQMISIWPEISRPRHREWLKPGHER